MTSDLCLNYTPLKVISLLTTHTLHAYVLGPQPVNKILKLYLSLSLSETKCVSTNKKQTLNRIQRIM